MSGDYRVVGLPADLAQELIAEGSARPLAVRGPMIEAVQLLDVMDVTANLITVGIATKGVAALCRRLLARRGPTTITLKSNSGHREIPIVPGMDPDELGEALREALDALEDDG